MVEDIVCVKRSTMRKSPPFSGAIKEERESQREQLSEKRKI